MTRRVGVPVADGVCELPDPQKLSYWQVVPLTSLELKKDSKVTEISGHK